MKLIKALFTLAIVTGLGCSAQAAVIAIIDSGTDLNHPDLINKQWTNPKDIEDAVDNDDNGYIDDVHGWNFAENNNKLYDKSLVGTFSQDCYRYFEVQTRLLKGTGSPDDIAWIKSAQKNESLMAELETFANFVHGSHVAGIASRDSAAAQLMIIKLIATKKPTIGPHQRNEMHAQTMRGDSRLAVSDKLVRTGLKLLAAQQGKALAPIGKYVQVNQARVANCSFGMSTNAAKTVLAPILKILLRREATPEELTTYAIFFAGEVLKSQATLVSSKQTLFVIAAGNDGMDNDQFPTSPANVKQDNTIAVAATLGYSKLASFSNYGNTMVEIAAPGVGIESSIPGNQHLTVSGTSQASPFVANIAGQVIDANPKLSNPQVKEILMATVDFKDFLKGKVVSGGIVNPERATLAARLSTSMSVSLAVSAARAQVGDVTESRRSPTSEYEGYVMPLPTLFE